MDCQDDLENTQTNVAVVLVEKDIVLNKQNIYNTTFVFIVFLLIRRHFKKFLIFLIDMQQYEPNFFVLLNVGMSLRKCVRKQMKKQEKKDKDGFRGVLVV